MKGVSKKRYPHPHLRANLCVNPLRPCGHGIGRHRTQNRPGSTFHISPQPTQGTARRRHRAPGTKYWPCDSAGAWMRPGKCDGVATTYPLPACPRLAGALPSSSVSLPEDVSHLQRHIIMGEAPDCSGNVPAMEPVSCIAGSAHHHRAQHNLGRRRCRIGSPRPAL